MPGNCRREYKRRMEYLSQECHDKIAAELENLITVEYPRIKDALSEARSQGDLSENCGYRAARSAQAKMISRIKFLQKVLMYSRVIDTKTLPKDEVTLLSRVEFTHLGNNSRMTYRIVSPHEMNLQEGKISLQSPIGQALMGRKAGDVVEVKAPAATFKLRIEAIDNGDD